MKQETFETSGKINSKGEPYFYMFLQFQDWCNQHKGKKFIVTFQVIDDSSTKQYVYFKEFIMPQFIKGMQETGEYMTDVGAEQFIQYNCPWLEDSHEKEEFFNMNQSKLNKVIEWLKQYMGENLNIYIND